MYYQSVTHFNGLQQKFASMIAILSLAGSFWVLLSLTYAFIVADFYFGFRLSRKVKKENPRVPISGKLDSAKWWRTISKGADSGIFIALACLADKFIFQEAFENWDKLYAGLLVTGFICGAEFWSMLETNAYLSDSKWAVWLRKYVKNKAQKHFHINFSDDENN